MTADRQRIDKWLWHARLVRTRSAAAGLATSGRVRVNGQRIDAAGRVVRPGDVVTVTLDGRVRVLRVVDFAERRGSADAACRLYEEVEAGLAGSGRATNQGNEGATGADVRLKAASLAPTRPMR